MVGGVYFKFEHLVWAWLYIFCFSVWGINRYAAIVDVLVCNDHCLCRRSRCVRSLSISLISETRYLVVLLSHHKNQPNLLSKRALQLREWIFVQTRNKERLWNWYGRTQCVVHTHCRRGRFPVRLKSTVIAAKNKQGYDLFNLMHCCLSSFLYYQPLFLLVFEELHLHNQMLRGAKIFFSLLWLTDSITYRSLLFVQVLCQVCLSCHKTKIKKLNEKSKSITFSKEARTMLMIIENNVLLWLSVMMKRYGIEDRKA